MDVLGAGGLEMGSKNASGGSRRTPKMIVGSGVGLFYFQNIPT